MSNKTKVTDVITEHVFTKIYDQNSWTGISRSGPGSDNINTVAVKKFLPKFISEYGVVTMLDAPCGDYNWMSEVQLEGVVYAGIDIVRDLIIENRKRYPDVYFNYGDITNLEVNNNDLFFCRDALVHLPTFLIRKALKNMGSSKFVMMTHFTGNRTYRDIEVGGWRPINWMLPPFNLPPPLVIYNEEYSDKIWSDKSMAVWLGHQLWM